MSEIIGKKDKHVWDFEKICWLIDKINKINLEKRILLHSLSAKVYSYP